SFLSSPSRAPPALLSFPTRRSSDLRGPAVVILPADVQTAKMQTPAAEHFVSRTGVGRPSTRISPPADELQRAAAVLDEGSKVAMLVGAGARGATEEVLAVADRLGAGIVTPLLGTDVVPGDVPHHTQQAGLLGSRPSYDMLQDCDTFLMVAPTTRTRSSSHPPARRGACRSTSRRRTSACAIRWR